MLSNSQIYQIRQLHKQGLSQQKIADQIGCSKPTVNKILNQGTSYRKKYEYLQPTKKYWNEQWLSFRDTAEDLSYYYDKYVSFAESKNKVAMPRNTFNFKMKNLVKEKCTFTYLLNYQEFEELLLCVGENFKNTMINLIGTTRVNKTRTFLDVKKVAINFFIYHKFGCNEEMFKLANELLTHGKFTKDIVQELNSNYDLNNNKKCYEFLKKIHDLTIKFSSFQYADIQDRLRNNSNTVC